MDDEYVVEEYSDFEDEVDSSSSEDELQSYLKKQCGIIEVEDDFESEVDKIMTAHMKKLEEPLKAKGENSKDENSKDGESTTNMGKDTSKSKDEVNDDLFYDPDMDDDDERWVNERPCAYIFPSEKESTKKLKPLPNSDAVLNCPACLSLLCLDCQRHEIYKSQYRAMFVSNCKIISTESLSYPSKKKKLKNIATTAGEIYNPVHCSVCNTEVAVYDTNEVFHFFNVLASYS